MSSHAPRRRRSACLAVVALGGLAAVPAVPTRPAAADPSFVQGSGRARASLFEVVPRTGGLELPYSFGKALVTYEGVSATATSVGGKLPGNPFATSPPPDAAASAPSAASGAPADGAAALAALAMAGLAPGDSDVQAAADPPPTGNPLGATLTVSSEDKGAAAGRHADQGAFPSGSPVQGMMERQDVSATKAPFGQATVEHGRLGVAPLFDASFYRAEADTGIVDGATRVAHAVVTAHRMSLLGGKVVLGDARWEATQRTGAKESADGAFTVGSAEVDGKAVDLSPKSDPPLDPFTAVNTLLAPSGASLVRPKVARADGVVSVSPLSIRIEDSPAGRAILAPIVGALEPVRDPVAKTLIGASDKLGTVLTAADVVSSMLTGTGGISFDFGGVTATTEGTRYDNPFTDAPPAGGFAGPGTGADVLPPQPAPAPAPSAAPPATPEPEAPPSSGPPVAAAPTVDEAPVAPAPAAATPAGGDEVASAPAPVLAGTADLGDASRHIPGHTGGRALAVGLLALLAVLALAAADAVTLRRAGRTIP